MSSRFPEQAERILVDMAAEPFGFTRLDVETVLSGCGITRRMRLTDPFVLWLHPDHPDLFVLLNTSRLNVSPDQILHVLSVVGRLRDRTKGAV